MSILLHILDTELIVEDYHGDFLLIKKANAKGRDLGIIAKAIFQKKYAFVEEVIVTEVEICLKLNAQYETGKLTALEQLIFDEKWLPKTHELPVRFSEHEDWGNIEAATGFRKATIIERLCAIDFSVAFLGFLPGFVYMNGLEPDLHVPRKSTPSKYIKANSVAIGGRYLGLYSIDSPGGWHVIGAVPHSVLDLSKLPPIAWNLNDKIRLISM